MEKRALFPGSFDPPTKGHLDIIRRAANFFDFLLIGIAQNFSKEAPLFSIEERRKMLQTLCQGIPRTEVIVIEGATSDVIRGQKVDCLLRSVRGVEDVTREYGMAQVHRLEEGVETVFFFSAPEWQWVQSRLLREMGAVGMPLDRWIPEQILSDVTRKWQKPGGWDE